MELAFRVPVPTSVTLESTVMMSIGQQNVWEMKIRKPSEHSDLQKSRTLIFLWQSCPCKPKKPVSKLALTICFTWCETFSGHTRIKLIRWVWTLELYVQKKVKGLGHVKRLWISVSCFWIWNTYWNLKTSPKRDYPLLILSGSEFSIQLMHLAPCHRPSLQQCVERRMRSCNVWELEQHMCHCTKSIPKDFLIDWTVLLPTWHIFQATVQNEKLPQKLLMISLQ